MIQTIMAIKRSMMLHAEIHWPEAADAQFWPMAIKHAVFLWNQMLSIKNGLSPIGVFTRTRRPLAVLFTSSTAGSQAARRSLDGSLGQSI
jgi:hypothetical protein